MGPPKSGRLFLKSHGDCFLHATAGWLSYASFKLSEDRLAIVQVTLPNGQAFCSTLCPAPISYQAVKRGVSRDKYLEIDPYFASELGLENDTQVVVEAVPSIERCTNLLLTPHNAEDLDTLVDNQEKIEFELLDRIRVVSASLHFPIWIDKTVIPVRVVRSEPSALWVLLVQNARICIEPSSASSPGTSSSVSSISTPGRSSSQGSGESPNSEHPSSNSLLSSTISSTLTAPFNYLLNSLRPNQPFQKVATDSSAPERETFPKRTTTTPEPATVSRTRTVHIASSVKPSPSQGKHSRMRSWHAGTDYGKRDLPDANDEPPQFLPPYSGTPKMNACLRVQPHPLRGISTSQSPPEGRWSYERIFDVFVHPSTLPEVHCYLGILHKCSSFLVELQPMVSPHVAAVAARKQTAASRDGGGYAASDAQSETVDDGLDDSQTSSGVESLIDIAQLIGTSTTPPSQGDASATSLPSPYLCRSLVARLCFATRIRCSGGQMVAEIDGIGTGTVDHAEESSEEAEVEEVWVKPGHILMSDPLRRQLRAGACSRVKLRQVKEEWRIPLVNKPSITIHLQPLDPQQANPDLVMQFREWIARVSRASEYSAALVEGQVIPLWSEKDGWLYYRVGLKPRPQKSHPISYCLIRPSDISNKFVKIASEHALQKVKSPPKLPAIMLPRLEDIDPPTISERRNDFGALGKLLADGSRYLDSVLAAPGAPGALLVCGQVGSGGVGCGKSSLARLLCKVVTQYPYCAHLTTVDCTSLRGQSVIKVKRRLKSVFMEAEWHQPSVVLLDDMDHATPHFLDAQEEAMGEGALSTRRAQVLLDIMSELHRKAAQVVVIATAESKQKVHLELLQSKGEHVFENFLEIAPPSLVDRRDILSAVLSNKARVPDNELTERDIRTIALKTEGFQAGDIVALVDRAMSHFELRLICPPKPLERTLSGRYSGRRAKTSMDSGEFSPLALGKAHKTDSIESLPSPKKRGPAFDYLHSETPPAHRKISNALSSASATTLVDEKIQVSVGDGSVAEPGSLTSLGLILDDFLRALKGFVPTSLRGLPLHSSGSVDFSSVGGLQLAKQTLRETLLWPSKYPKLFNQCPIKQRFGVLLYGAPGTGKTLLAGAVAKEFGLHFVSIKGPELLNKYIGASEQAVRDMFTRAQAAKPCILFFDEFDSLAPKRGHDRTGVTDRVVNQLLTQLDGVESIQGVYVLAASSRPDLIDPALLRPGRIDRNLFCDIPTQEERLAILEALSKGMLLDNRADLQTIAKQTEAFTGADLKALLYNAQLQSAHEVLERRAHSSREAQTETGGDDTPARQRKEAGEREDGRALVFKFSDTGLTRETVPQLESKVAVLYNSPMRRQSTLTIRGARKAKQKLKATITRQHLLNALDDVRPSVTPAERKKFDRIYEKFQGKVKVALADVKEQRATMA